MKLKRNGTIFVHAGKWYYAVKLPGWDRRRQVPLKAPGAEHALAADRPRKLAEEAAARMWDEAAREERTGERGMLVEDLCAAYSRFLPTYYRDGDGNPTKEATNIQLGIRLFRSMYGNSAVTELTHSDMMALRDAHVRSGVARVTVNKRIAYTKMMFAWALDEGLVTASVKAELTQVRNLKRGRSQARECPPVRPIDDESVDRMAAELMPNTADMVRLHQLTGMRPEEVCQLNWGDIDTSRVPWVYRPNRHKNQWRGMPRVVLIGPKGREVLERHRGTGIPFSPAQAVIELHDAWRMSRVSKVPPSQLDRRVAEPVKRPGEAWDSAAYTHAIHRACRKAGIPIFGANRLRHSFATKVRSAYGLDACRAVLGHSGGLASHITDRYSYEALEEEQIRAASAAVEALG